MPDAQAIADDDHFDASADAEIASCLNLDTPKSFFLFAGAGSGKTRSLIDAIKHVRRTYGRRLALTRQKIGVVTYTNAACDEILRRLDYDPRVVVSTIHSFAWSLISGYNDDIRAYLKVSLAKRIAELTEELAKARNTTTKTYQDNLRSLASRNKRLAALDGIKKFVYSPTGDNRTRDALNHAEVIQITSQFLTEKVTLRSLLISQFPILLVDESQDTNRHLMDALLSVQRNHKASFALGLLGDTMQRIYGDGKVGIEKALGDDWILPRKTMNHRCPQRVIRLLNRIRRDVDATTQKGRSDKPEGYVRIFAIQENGANKAAVEKYVSERMAAITGDPGWSPDARGVKTLTLEHHMAAVRFGFAEMFAPLYPQSRLQTALIEGTLPALNFFAKQVLPTVKALEARNDFELASIARKASPLLSDEALKTGGSQQLVLAKQAATSLFAIFGKEARVTFRAVLENVATSGLFEVPEALVPFASPDAPGLDVEAVDEREAGEAAAWREMLQTDFRQIEAYDQYVTKLSPFGTHQGVKGLEFPRVMVIISDEESRGFLFKYEKLFGVEPPSDTDRKHEAAGEETGNDRARRLFYVTCSRAEESLAIACYTKAPDLLLRNVVERGWFERAETELVPGTAS
ncbi:MULTISPECIES: UvrD-helicase domain-containing protein [unclassified Mesorhizobium]|uniref:UvrD-helicase domain-containing protein n=1 Tax=unclassified Mesorhizobium TaxID=325217 RepID=UPI0011281D88|nr:MULTISPECIES: UvrD-helicase domain-containing protein [unclassified Mesorhizobium]TPM89621.1 ATP-dependent helicase [Mesorhizobium sp. B2-1-5]TPN31913.1 ATP-dependent helicase [Mesorhizobium sp. B1-1-6]